MVEEVNSWKLVKAVQELEAENEELKDRLSVIEERMAKLEGTANGG